MIQTQERILWCDCHGEERLARISGEKLIITDRRHGQRHTLVLTLDILNRLILNSKPTTE